ncbi:MAG: type II CAAX endopeptidase family protein [Acutalibacteraceae bacterium]|nr:type II CAAX endopeptidase family protein [Acutalibacteraceae bacterium]
MNNFYNNTGVPVNGNLTQPVYNNQQNQQYIPAQGFQPANVGCVGNQFNGGFVNYSQPVNYGVNAMPISFGIDLEQLEKERKKEEERKKIKSAANKVAGGALIFAGLTQVIATLLMFPLSFTSAYDMNNSGYIQGIEPIALYIINAIVSLVGMGIAGVITIKFFRLRIDDALQVNKVKISDIIKYTFAGMGFAFVFNLLLSLMNLNLGIFGFENNMPSYGEIEGVVGNIIYYFALALVPPIAEEFLFRGAILGSLRKYGDAFAIIISSILFGFAHANFLQTPVTFLTGLVLGYVTVKSNSIIPAVIIHFVNNSLAFLQETLENVITNENINSLVNSGIAFAFLIAGFICIILLIRKHQNNLFTLEKPEGQLTMSQKIRASFLTPCMIIFTIYTIAMCIVAAVSP